MSTLKVDQLEAATASTITVPSGQTLDISSATLTPPATMPASSAANLTSIPAANITGTIAAVSGANLTALNATQLTSGAVPAARMPAGSVLQVVVATDNTMRQGTNSSWDHHSTTLEASITPASTSSRIYMTSSFSGGCPVDNETHQYTIFRDGTTNLGDANTGLMHIYGADNDNYSGVTIAYVDSPNTVSSTTYRVYCKRASASAVYINYGSAKVSLILMEIAG